MAYPFFIKRSPGPKKQLINNLVKYVTKQAVLLSEAVFSSSAHRDKASLAASSYMPITSSIFNEPLFKASNDNATKKMKLHQ